MSWFDKFLGTGYPDVHVDTDVEVMHLREEDGTLHIVVDMVELITVLYRLADQAQEGDACSASVSALRTFADALSDTYTQSIRERS